MRILFFLMLLVSCNTSVEKVSKSAATLSNPSVGSGYLIFQENAVGFSGASRSAKSDTFYSIERDAGRDYLLSGQTTSAFGEKELILLKLKENGVLDSTFGNGKGYVISDEGSYGAGGSYIKAEYGTAKYDQNGKIIVVGCSTTYGSSPTSYCPLTIWRFNSDGSKDTNFGYGDGYVVFNRYGAGFAGGQASYRAELTGRKSFTIDASNRIVVWGQSKTSSGTMKPFIARFESDGSLDTTFNSIGYYLGSESSYFANLELDGQGQYIFGGQKTTSTGSAFTIWKMQSNGTLDLTMTLLDGLTGPAGASYANREDCSLGYCDFKIDHEGRFLLAGSSKNASGNFEMVFMRYLNDGTLDTEFASVGHLVFQNGLEGAAGASALLKEDRAVTLEQDPTTQKYLITGHSRDVYGNQRVYMWRYHSGGGLDTNFGGGDGHMTVLRPGGNISGTNDSVPSKLVFSPEGSILLPGYRLNIYGGREPVLYLFQNDGTADSGRFL